MSLGTVLRRAEVLEQTRVALQDPTSQASIVKPVVATNRLRSLVLARTPVIPQDAVDARGYRVSTGQAGQQGEHTTLAVSGQLSFYDMLFALAVNLCKPVITTPVINGGSAQYARQYAFRPAAVGIDPFHVFTLDNGAGLNAASRCDTCALSSLSFTFARDKPSFGGAGFGRELAEAGVIISDETAMVDAPLYVIGGNQWSISVADTVANLSSATKLTSCYQTSISMNQRFAPVFVGDQAQHSFIGYAEAKNDVMGGINIEQNAFAQNDVMVHLRNIDQRFARIYSCGPLIETVPVGGLGATQDFSHKLQITYPFNYTNPRPGTEQGTVSGEYDLRAIYDAPSDSYLEILLTLDMRLAGPLLALGTALPQSQWPDTLVPLRDCAVY